MTYAEVLNFVFESGRIQSSSKNWEEYAAEVAAEVEFEATEKINSGELDGNVEDCVQFALNHIS